MNISLAYVNKGQISFSWDAVAVECSAIEYKINATNCGRCPRTTFATVAACTDLEITDEQTCSFGISTVVCSDIVGTMNKFEVVLKGDFFFFFCAQIPFSG